MLTLDLFAFDLLAFDFLSLDLLAPDFLRVALLGPSFTSGHSHFSFLALNLLSFNLLALDLFTLDLFALDLFAFDFLPFDFFALNLLPLCDLLGPSFTSGYSDFLVRPLLSTPSSSPLWLTLGFLARQWLRLS